MGAERIAEAVGFLGNSRKGKTHLAREVIKYNARKYKDLHFVIWDAAAVSGQFVFWDEDFQNLDEEGNPTIIEDPKSLPIHQAMVVENLIQHPSDIDKMIKDHVLTREEAKKIDWLYPSDIPIPNRKHIRYLTVQGKYSSFDAYLDLVYRAGYCCAVIDEIDLVHKKAKMRPRLEQLVNAGAHIGDKKARKMGVSFIWAARRFAKVHNDILAKTRTFFAFQLTLKSDLQAFAGNVSSEHDQYLPGFGRGDFYRIDDDGSHVTEGVMDLPFLNDSNK